MFEFGKYATRIRKTLLFIRYVKLEHKFDFGKSVLGDQ